MTRNHFCSFYTQISLVTSYENVERKEIDEIIYIAAVVYIRAYLWSQVRWCVPMVTGTGIFGL